MIVPEQKPGRSRQDYGTPREFIDAVEARWGKLDWDLAASAENAKAPNFITAEEDSLKARWRTAGRSWLNPPFGDLTPWAKKCVEICGWLSNNHGQLFLLTPASIGAKWFSDYVHGKARVYALQPRLTFEGCTAPYPKDCILSVYGEPPGFDVWRWK